MTVLTGVYPFVSSQVRELAESVLRDPVFLTVGNDNAGAASIDQRLMYVGREEGKLLAIRQLVQDGLRPPVVVFLQSKDRAQVCQPPHHPRLGCPRCGWYFHFPDGLEPFPYRNNFPTNSY